MINQDKIYDIEKDREKSLQYFEILDSEPEDEFNRAVRLASNIFGVSASAVSLLDRDRVFLKASVGLCGATSMPRKGSFCNYAVEQLDRLFIVEDALEDPRFCNSPFVQGPPHIRFYAGAPLVTQDGIGIGALCLFDTKPRSAPKPREHKTMHDLASVVVDELMLRLASREAEEAMRLSKDLSTTKATFMASMNHELRNPINAILGFGQLLDLEKNPDTERGHSYVRHILDSGQHMLSLLNNLIEMSQLEAGKAALHIEPLSLAEEVDHVINMLTPQAHRRNLTLTNAVDRNCIIQNDRLRFRQILINLIGNAVKYNNDSGWIYIQNRSTDSGNLCLDIDDSGIGIDSEDLKRLFRPFERAVQGADAPEGTGLGLALCKRLSQAMGGDILLYPRPPEAPLGNILSGNIRGGTRARFILSERPT